MNDLFRKGKPLLLALLVVPFFAGAVYAAWNYIPPTSPLAALTQVQIQAILSVLSSFGVDEATVLSVERALLGEETKTGSTEVVVPEVVPPAPQEPEKANEIVISVSPTPKAQTVPAGTTYVHMASFVFDATSLGESVSFSSLKFLYTDNALYDPYNCAIFSGPEEFMTRYTKATFNPDWVHPAGTGDKEFTLNTPLVIPKGEKKIVDIRCNTNTRAFTGTGSFSWGLSGFDGKATFTGVGADSKEIITPKVVPDIGNTMTFAS